MKSLIRISTGPSTNRSLDIFCKDTVSSLWSCRCYLRSEICLTISIRLSQLHGKYTLFVFKIVASSFFPLNICVIVLQWRRYSALANNGAERFHWGRGKKTDCRPNAAREEMRTIELCYRELGQYAWHGGTNSENFGVIFRFKPSLENPRLHFGYSCNILFRVGLAA